MNFAPNGSVLNVAALNATEAVPMEDEVGDVLEKGMARARLGLEQLATKSSIAVPRLRDALDYRSELTTEELGRAAAVLGLNEVGLCALAAGKYPRPELGPLPFSVWPLRSPHGVGCTNAYLVARSGSDTGLLFDTGANMPSICEKWPAGVRKLAAVFITHVEAEHAGGLCEIVNRFAVPSAFIPAGISHPCGRETRDGERFVHDGLEVTTLSTPGHAAAHNCYWIRASGGRGGSLLISGDLLFAGSVGAGYFSSAQQDASLRKVMVAVPQGTIVAPGHGPMTTMRHELAFNPFAPVVGAK
jgi:glyoxylase-like metal-dependent hydrolase (beta-lactamase superfamily II)